MVGSRYPIQSVEKEGGQDYEVGRSLRQVTAEAGGCPDVKLANGQIRSCTCQPCSSGSLSDCSCNKETGCGCSSSVLPLDSPDRCPCAASGKTCSCDSCACKGTPLPGTCCS
ncbi:hypothetical protein H4Q26_000919 [Puccinia striiformis f. sp. tritici PST-130]|nr:hypothetical protein H4Q26_000919 [Puccinia striiformis f. sp. tritici PST-130]